MALFTEITCHGYEATTKIILWLGVATTRRTVLKGPSIRKVESCGSGLSAECF